MVFFCISDQILYFCSHLITNDQDSVCALYMVSTPAARGIQRHADTAFSLNRNRHSSFLELQQELPLLAVDCGILREIL